MKRGALMRICLHNSQKASLFICVDILRMSTCILTKSGCYTRVSVVRPYACMKDHSLLVGGMCINKIIKKFKKLPFFFLTWPVSCAKMENALLWRSGIIMSVFRLKISDSNSASIRKERKMS